MYTIEKMAFFATVIGVMFLWLTVLSWYLYRTRKHYFNLVTGTRKEKLDAMLEELINNDRLFSGKVNQITKSLTETIKHSQLALRKIGLVSYSPFERGGGEQSFVIAILNEYDSGLVINFIYTREGLRSYIKKVKEGKGDKYELSEEEIEAIKKST